MTASLTVTQLIAPHSPHDLPTGDQAGVCYICAAETGQGQRRAPSDAFTAWAACAVGDVLCPACAATLGWRDVRMFSWLATPGGVRFEGRGDRGWMWDVLIDPPEPPFAIYITQGGQKQGWISGARQIATSRTIIPVLTDWTDRPVMLRRADIDRHAPLILRLRGYGVGRNATRDGTFTANQWKKAVQGGYDHDLQQAVEYAGDPRWEILAHVSNDPGKDGDDATAGATGQGGIDPAAGDGLQGGGLENAGRQVDFGSLVGDADGGESR